MMEWQPIETAPRDGTSVLLSGGQLACSGDIEENEIAVVAKICNAYGSEAWSVVRISGQEVWLWNPTHWMPLPAPPTD
jgi:hypothetical protein